MSSCWNFHKGTAMSYSHAREIHLSLHCMLCYEIHIGHTLMSKRSLRRTHLLKHLKLIVSPKGMQKDLLGLFFPSSVLWILQITAPKSTVTDVTVHHLYFETYPLILPQRIKSPCVGYIVHGQSFHRVFGAWWEVQWWCPHTVSVIRMDHLFTVYFILHQSLSIVTLNSSIFSLLVQLNADKQQQGMHQSSLLPVKQTFSRLRAFFRLHNELQHEK